MRKLQLKTLAAKRPQSKKVKNNKGDFMLKEIKFKTWVKIFAVILASLFIARPWIEKGSSHIPPADSKKYKIEVVDDSGYRVRLEKPADRIISLYSAHTENLFSLGLDREIIGVGKSDIYPSGALDKKVFDYRSDPEKIISQNPDIVIIRPFIERNSPDFVNALRRSGINVVSLYPESFSEFDDYIMKLAVLTGKENTASKKLKDFHEDLEAMGAATSGIDQKVGVYFESSDRDYTTVTQDSMPSYALQLAGGINVAGDVEPIKEGSSIAAYGIENILQKGDEIDVYVTQRGAMGGGGNTHSISIRPGFNSINAVKNGRIVEINQKIISSPTFRFTKGVNELRRAFYPEIFDSIEWDKYSDNITRGELSEILLKYTHSPIFIPSTSYYNDPGKEHYYGKLEDVTTGSTYFDSVETSLQRGYFEVFNEDDVEYFHPDSSVTREELAKILYIIGNLKNDSSINIGDIKDVQNTRIVKSVVSNNLMGLESGMFNPQKSVSKDEVSAALETLQVISNDNV